jgi:hypothetical protein
MSGLPMSLLVTPAKLAGAQCPALRSHAGGMAGLLNGVSDHEDTGVEIPAFAGMTKG